MYTTMIGRFIKRLVLNRKINKHEKNIESFEWFLLRTDLMLDYAMLERLKDKNSVLQDLKQQLSCI